MIDPSPRRSRPQSPGPTPEAGGLLLNAVGGLVPAELARSIGQDAVFSLPTEPLAHARPILHPGQDRLGPEAPERKQAECVSQDTDNALASGLAK